MQSFPRKSAGFLLSAGLCATLGLAASIGVPANASAEECPGHPDALGTSRVLVVDPSKIQRVGVMQYPQSLPLADKEVVLTFDDGPLPPHSNAVLDTLAEQCVKATFFLVGEMARAFPSVVRRIHEEGHTIGTHTEHHPLRMHRMPIDKAREEIDRGIADVGGALWDDKDLAPFFRIPGLARTDAIEKELAQRGLVVFSSDTVADDWHRRIRSEDIVRLSISRLEARGKGILLLHDIHRTTANALPDLLKKLKAAGFHVVHIVPGTEQPAVAAASPAAKPAPSAANSSAPAPAAPPAAVAAGNADRASSPDGKDAGKATVAAADGNQSTAANDTSGPKDDKAIPHVAEPSANEVIAANDPPADRGETAQTAPSPLYNRATATDGNVVREPDGAKPETAETPASNNQIIAAVAPAAGQNEVVQPASAAPNIEADQAAKTDVATPQSSDRDPSPSEKVASAEAAQTADEPAQDMDDPIWPKPLVDTLADVRAELPAPDVQVLCADYRPWHTVKLADGSQTAGYLALDAVPQWTDPPVATPVRSDEAGLPAPAVPYYFGGGEVVTSIAE
jgi:peptidoglycan/xylan/chitin deacetylase (PgdA/CDA1 family)